MSLRFPRRFAMRQSGLLSGIFGVPLLGIALLGCGPEGDDDKGAEARESGLDRDAAAASGSDWEQWDDPTRAETNTDDWDHWEGDPREDSSDEDWDYWDDDPRPDSDGGSGSSWDYWDGDPRPEDDGTSGGSTGGSSGGSSEGSDWCDWEPGGSDGGSGSGSDGGSGSGGTFEYPSGGGSGWSPEDFSYVLRLGDNGQYYIIVKDAVQLDLAEDACEDFGGWLAYINDEDELEDVYDMIYSTGGPYWATWIGELASDVKVELFSREQIDKYTLSRGEGWVVQNDNNDVYIGADLDERYHPFACEMPLE
jgi:hypothetical protein